ncbi:hypothetical protein ACIQTU_15585 [Brevundimonas sp. NPDC090276]|uniref:hypothetical protein n=1 Tax=Brevundimonas sp. NPDC090276 TaxID=3363956 RepID=UPI00383B17A6
MTHFLKDQLEAFVSTDGVEVVSRSAKHLCFTKSEGNRLDFLSYAYVPADLMSVPRDIMNCIPRSYLELLAQSNGLRLLGGAVIFYGFLFDNDRFGERDGPVPISLEEKIDLFARTHPSLWGRGLRPIGAVASNVVETILAEMNGGEAFCMNSRGELVSIGPVFSLFDRSINILHDCFGGKLLVDAITCREFMIRRAG